MNVSLNSQVVRTGIPSVYYINSDYVISTIVGYVVILVDCVSGPVTITLRSASSNTDCFVIKKIDSNSTYTVNITSSPDTIDGSSLASISVQYTSLTLVSDGSNWHII